ncbi:MAG: sensor histidine kinase [Thainema sp.]
MSKEILHLGELVEQCQAKIVEQWTESVQQHRDIEAADELPPMAIRDHVPSVLSAIADCLKQYDYSNAVEAVASASLSHGVLRAKQGFDPTEVVQEYRLLRQAVIRNLEPYLESLTPSQIFSGMNVVNEVVDLALTKCFESYVESRLQELEQLKEQVKLTTGELSQLVHTSQEQVAFLAHELKTPLNSIIGYSELLLRQQQGALSQSVALDNLDSLERVLRNGQRLLKLVNQVLEFSYYENQSVQLDIQLVQPRQLLQTVVETLEPLASKKGLDIIIDCDRAPETVETDPLKLEQVLINLGSNAIRYTEKGHVQLTAVAVADQQWQLAIADTGIGMDTETQKKIFEPFFRAQSPDAQKNLLWKGTGLGLAITAKIVVLLKGELEVVSKLNDGSTFTVQLPTAYGSLDKADID